MSETKPVEWEDAVRLMSDDKLERRINEVKESVLQRLDAGKPARPENVRELLLLVEQMPAEREYLKRVVAKRDETEQYYKSLAYEGWENQRWSELEASRNAEERVRNAERKAKRAEVKLRPLDEEVERLRAENERLLAQLGAWANVNLPELLANTPTPPDSNRLDD